MRIFCFWVFLLMEVNICAPSLCIAAFFSSFFQTRGVCIPVADMADTVLKKDLEMYSTITTPWHVVELNVGEIRLRLRGKLILGGGC